MAPNDTRFPGGTRLPGAFHISSNGHDPVALDARPPTGTGRLEAAELGPFRLESGDRLPDVTIAYRHDGPGPDAPQAVVVHALTGSADAAGDWWTPLIGPGRALDTDRVGVLCINLLGGCYGSTGPTSIDPNTGLAWGSRFPQPTARDEARVIWAVADRLGIESLALVTGGSMGGMIALEVALERPTRVGHVAAIASPAATGPMALGWNHIQLELIDRLGWEGLALARQLAMTTYRSEADFETRFGRTVQDDGRFAISSYLDHQGVKLLERFDPETYRVLARVIDSHDIGRDRGGAVEALRALAEAGTGLTGVGVTGDILYGPVQVQGLLSDAAEAGVQVAYREVATIKGHDAFLIEWDQLSPILAEALDDGIARSSHQQEVLALPA